MSTIFQTSSVVRLGNGVETPALLMFVLVVAYLTSQFSIMLETLYWLCIYTVAQLHAHQKKLRSEKFS